MSCEKSDSMDNTTEVDLGLPSGLIWSTKDVGADKIYDHGTLLSWGETEAKSDYRQDSYSPADAVKWAMELPCEYDAASVLCGDDWRTPTREDFAELISNTVRDVITVGGAQYVRFKGTNGKSICFRLGDSYWSADAMQKDTYAWVMSFKDTEAEVDYMELYEACIVRPVKCNKSDVDMSAEVNREGAKLSVRGQISEDISKISQFKFTLEPGAQGYSVAMDTEGTFNLEIDDLALSQSYDYSFETQDRYGRVRKGSSGTIAAFATEISGSMDVDAKYSTAEVVSSYSVNFDFTEVTQTVYYGSQTTSDALVADGQVITSDSDRSDITTAVTGLTPGTSYNYCVKAVFFVGEETFTFLSPVKSFTTLAIPEHAVDLGLPSGRLWRDVNIDAEVPGDLGGYYAYAELETKTNYIPENNKYVVFTEGPYGRVRGYSKYSVDEVLEPEDDIAHVRLGGDWHMPTTKDCSELVGNCTASAGTAKNSKGEDVNGFWITGPNSNKIFLPLTGRYDGTTLKLSDRVFISSSTAGAWGPSYSRGIVISASGSMETDRGTERYIGRCVRAVL